MNYETTIYQLFNNVIRYMKAQPLNLGGFSTYSGGNGGPPGGYMGYLPQDRVAYDLSEAESSITPSGATLVDNLNHIRNRLAVVEAAGNPLILEQDHVVIASGIHIVSFNDFFEVTQNDAQQASVTLLSSGVQNVIYSGVYNEDLTYQTDGIGQHFTVANTISDTSLCIYYGQHHQEPDTYTLDADHKGFTTTFIPVSGTSLVVDYTVEINAEYHTHSQYALDSDTYSKDEIDSYFGNYSLSPHYHVEADILDLEHNATEIQNIPVSGVPPEDEQVLQFDASTGYYVPTTLSATASGSGVGGNTVRLHKTSAATSVEYPATNAGLGSAIAAAVSGDEIEGPYAVVIACTSTKSLPNGVKVRNLNINFTGGHTLTTTGNDIFHCKIQSTGDVVTFTSTSSTIRDSLIINASTTSNGVTFGSSAQGKIYNTLIYQSGVPVDTRAIYIQTDADGANIYFDNVHTYGCGYGLDSREAITAWNCYFSGTGYGASSATGTYNQCTFVGGTTDVVSGGTLTNCKFNTSSSVSYGTGDRAKVDHTHTAATISHNHTSTASDGGTLTNDTHDGYSDYLEIVAPASPAADTARMYARDTGGITKIYYKRSDGTEIDMAGGAGSGAGHTIMYSGSPFTQRTNLDFTGDVVVTDIAGDDKTQVRITAAGGSNQNIGCRVYNTASTSLPTASGIILTFNSERWDTDSIHSTSVNPSRLTCNTAGVYLILAQARITYNAGLGNRSLTLFVNNNEVARTLVPAAGPSSDTRLSVETIWKLEIGDYVEVQAYQSSGVTLNSEVSASAWQAPEFMMQLIAAT